MLACLRLGRVQDLAAEGRLETLLVYSPDRLSCKYPYQVLLTKEMERSGVERCFVNSPTLATPDDHLLVQFQGSRRNADAQTAPRGAARRNFFEGCCCEGHAAAGWIETPVPALISEARFAAVQEQLKRNRRQLGHGTQQPNLLQGMLVCKQ